MIDLSKRGLPDTIEANGRLFELKTDFREWIEFDRTLRETGDYYMGVFDGPRPFGTDWHEPLMEFYASPNPTPRSEGRDGPRVIDLIDDGELIVAAFRQAYGIDLTEGKMHWHLFKALLNGIPDDTRLAQVMSIRGYKKPPKNQDADAEMRKRQREWALRDPGYDEARADVLKWAEETFGD